MVIDAMHYAEQQIVIWQILVTLTLVAALCVVWKQQRQMREVHQEFRHIKRMMNLQDDELAGKIEVITEFLALKESKKIDMVILGAKVDGGVTKWHVHCADCDCCGEVWTKEGKVVNLPEGGEAVRGGQWICKNCLNKRNAAQHQDMKDK